MTLYRHFQLLSPRRDVLEVLARLKYATVDQVTYWLAGKSRSWVYGMLATLEKSGLVKRHKILQPHVFSLTHKGCRPAGVKAPSGTRMKSWSVISHRCHRNCAEIRLREHYSEFKFSKRLDLYRYGVNPGHGEHFGIDNDVRIFMLLDDYFFESSRISYAWNRTHTPDRIHFDRNNRVHKWSDIATMYVVAATDENQYEAHKNYINKHDIDDVAVLKLEAIW